MGHLVSAKELSQGLQVSSEEANILISCCDRKEAAIHHCTSRFQLSGRGLKTLLELVKSVSVQTPCSPFSS